MTILARTRTVATRPTRVSPAKPLPFGDGIDPTPAALPRQATKPAPIVRDEYRPAAQSFAPAVDDRTWAEVNLHDVFEMKPAPPFWGRLEAMGR
jgi:hypothetical protein